MNKNYKTIATFLGFESVASDKENGLYLQEELADKIEARLAEVAEMEATLQAKEQELADLNAKLANIEAEHASAIAEKEAALTAKAEECATLGDRISELEAALAAKEAELSEKDATIATLNDKVSEQQQTIEAKEAEIAALSEAAPDPQTPANTEGTQQQQEPKKPWSQMTDEEKAAEWGM